jgi:hypothetical protein
MRNVAFAICVSVLTTVIGCNQPSAGDSGRSPAKLAAPKLEYMREYWTSLGTDAAKLNTLGEQGWEVCAVVPGTSGSDREVVFKRPKQ